MKKILGILIILTLCSTAHAQDHTLTGKLVCTGGTCTLPPHCGTMAFAQAFKFEIITTTYTTQSKYMVAMVECPEFLGESFFIDGAVYNLTLIPKSTAEFSWAIVNPYEEENLPTLWVAKITKPTN
jgi:hypothetical protein